jgi:hypothetical protein
MPAVVAANAENPTFVSHTSQVRELNDKFPDVAHAFKDRDPSKLVVTHQKLAMNLHRIGPDGVELAEPDVSINTMYPAHADKYQMKFAKEAPRDIVRMLSKEKTQIVELRYADLLPSDNVPTLNSRVSQLIKGAQANYNEALDRVFAQSVVSAVVAVSS